jgi:hypothetical protein
MIVTVRYGFVLMLSYFSAQREFPSVPEPTTIPVSLNSRSIANMESGSSQKMGDFGVLTAALGTSLYLADITSSRP